MTDYRKRALDLAREVRQAYDSDVRATVLVARIPALCDAIEAQAAENKALCDKSAEWDHVESDLRQKIDAQAAEIESNRVQLAQYAASNIALDRKTGEQAAEIERLRKILESFG